MTTDDITADQLFEGPVSRQVPAPGSFGLARIGGLTGKLVAAGQAFAGDGSRWTHAFVVLDKGQCIEAEPGGARIVSLDRYLKMEEVVFSDAPIKEWIEDRIKSTPTLFQGPGDFWSALEEQKRGDVVRIARVMEGTAYGYLQYLFLGLYALGIEWKWLRKLISNRGRLICSQLVDEVYRRANIKVFDDDRLAQDVTPGDLAIRYGIG